MERSETAGTGRNGLVWAGMALIALVGLIHLIEAPEYLEETAYVGLLFLANAAGSIVAAYGIFRGRGWAWPLGVLIAGGAFVAYVLSRTVGLPGAPDLAGDSFFEPTGVASLVVEALFVVVYAVGSARRTLTA